MDCENHWVLFPNLITGGSRRLEKELHEVRKQKNGVIVSLRRENDWIFPIEKFSWKHPRPFRLNKQNRFMLFICHGKLHALGKFSHLWQIFIIKGLIESDLASAGFTRKRFKTFNVFWWKICADWFGIGSLGLRWKISWPLPEKWIAKTLIRVTHEPPHRLIIMSNLSVDCSSSEAFNDLQFSPLYTASSNDYNLIWLLLLLISSCFSARESSAPTLNVCNPFGLIPSNIVISFTLVS